MNTTSQTPSVCVNDDELYCPLKKKKITIGYSQTIVFQLPLQKKEHYDLIGCGICRTTTINVICSAT